MSFKKIIYQWGKSTNWLNEEDLKLDELVVAGGDKAVVLSPKVELAVVMVPFEPYKVLLVPLVPYMVLEVLFWEVP